MSLAAVKTSVSRPTPLAGPAGATSPGGPPKILLLIDGMASITDGGTERQLLQLVGIARKAGLAPTIAVLRETRWLTPELAGCPVWLGSFRSLRTVGGWRELARLALWMRRERFQILETFFTDANLLGPLLGRAAAIPAILGTRRSLNPTAPAPQRGLKAGLAAFVAGRLRGLSNRWVTELITNAEAVSANILATEAISPDRVTAIYNGVDLKSFEVSPSRGAAVRQRLQLSPEHVLVGNISGLRPVKRLDLFLRAAAIAGAAAPDLRFVLVGEGPERSSLEDLVEQLGLRGRVTLAGAAEDVRPWLAAFDLGVLCSEAEGFSNSILEYMASALPVIATAVGGNREALGEALSASGCLVPSGDAEALARAMVSLARAETREPLGRLARERARRFSLDQAEARVAALYRSHCPQLHVGQAVHPAAQSSGSAPPAQASRLFLQTATGMHTPALTRADESKPA